MKLISKCLLGVSLLLTYLITSSQTLERECIEENTTAQSVIAAKVSLFNQLAGELQNTAEDMIQQFQITNTSNVLSFENLEAVIDVANWLEELDRQYIDTFAAYCNAIVQALWNASICTEGLSFSEYKEEVFDYLEEEKFNFIESYASTKFAEELNFQSALLKINADEEEWLESVGEDFDDNNPAFDQVVNNESVWSVFSEDWNIELRHPEDGLDTLTGYGKIWQKIWWNDRNDVGGPMVATDEVFVDYDFIEIIQFLLDNWDTIEDIFDWINENVTGDCHASANTHVGDDWRNIPSSLSPDRERRIYYHVKQKGVFGDFRSTKTKIEGKAKLYKKKNSRFKKDWNNVVGIGYCTLQWNPCDDEPWPVDDNPHIYGGDHEHGKAKFKHRHPYALTIYRSGDFLTYYLYYNFQSTGELIFALGSNISCT